MNLEGRLVSGLLAAIVSLSGCRIESSAISSTDMRETVQSQREFERAVKHNFDYDGGDRREMEGLIRSSTTSRVVMFGISHGERPQDRKDGNFVAHLLSYYHRLGFKYVAVEAPASLNNYLKTPKFEGKVQEEFGKHWSQFGPVVMKARELGMQLVFYDVEQDYKGTYSERERSSVDILSGIFDRDPAAKMIIYCGARHARKEPQEVSFVDHTEVRTIGTAMNEKFGKALTTVFLKPPEGGVAFMYDYSFYLGKRALTDSTLPLLEAQE